MPVILIDLASFKMHILLVPEGNLAREKPHNFVNSGAVMCRLSENIFQLGLKTLN